MIRILDKQISDKIAAGEVITSPAAVVKELVENAIDAGATAVTVEIQKGGKELIRVTDNGTGIPSDEVELAFAKHATGKIATEEDLTHIGTLGFRGEALGSIATVSDLEMVTRTASERAGTRLLMEEGVVKEKGPIGCEQGTTITVMHLFYHTPARLKFMRTDRGEGALIRDLMSKIAIAYPEIRIRLISGGSVLFATRGDGDGLAAILAVYGGSLKSSLIPVFSESADGTLSMRAYIAPPTENRPSRRSQIFFVNGRLVHDKSLDRAVARAYKNRMFAGRYPIVYLFLDVSPTKLDVNIHPSKDQVRFFEAETIEDFVESALSNALQTAEAAPAFAKGAGKPATKAGIDGNRGEANGNGRAETTGSADAIPSSGYAELGKSAPSAGEGEPGRGFREESGIPGASAADPGKARPSDISAGRGESQLDVSSLLSTLRKKKQIREGAGQIAADSADAVTDDTKPLDFRSLEVHGIIFNTYILASDDRAFYMIDQHAAHERVRFEAIMNRFRSGTAESQILLVPYNLEGVAEPSEEADWLTPLQNMGFSIEPFGPSAYIIREIPMAFVETDLDSFFKDYLDSFQTIDPAGEQWYTRIATMACKGAVKAHDALSEAEAKQLLDELAECEHPFSCPHGRPTFLRMTLGEIEHNFRRR